MERMRQYRSAMVTGWEVQQVREIVAEALVDLIEPAVFQEAVALIDEHRAAGRDVVLVSASGSELVEPIAGMLGADEVIATRMVVEDGRYTGEVAFYAYGENKAAAIRDLAAARGYRLEDSYAYSDSATDIPMLASVGHPIAVNPDRALRREAAARGWPILDFTQPAPLRRRLPGPDARPAAMVAVVLGATAVSAALAWSAVRSRRTGVRKSPRRPRRRP
jgi:HAD superfamily hydrolase (TIGR01490 family)